MSTNKKSKSFVKNELLESGYKEDPENLLDSMSFTKLLQLRKDHALKKLEESGTELSEEDKKMSKVEIESKIKEKLIHITPSITGLFSSF